jgi:hypothetical protein
MPRSSGEEEASAAQPGTGTDDFLDTTKEETTLISFHHHLTSMDGKIKSEMVADQMATDVSKFHAFPVGSRSSQTGSGCWSGNKSWRK